MNEHDRLGDPAFDRLVAADPARRAPDPVPGVLRAKVDALIAEQTGQQPAGQKPAEQESPGREAPGSTDELALRRHRRRAPWLVAAAVAGIVAAGGGGYLAGGSGVGSAPTADMAEESAAEPPSVLGAPDGDPESGVENEGPAGTERGDAEAAPEGVEPLRAAGGDLPTVTGLVFHAGVGLSDAPRTAELRVVGTPGESLGSYPVVSEVEAVERLGDPRFAGGVLGRSERDLPQEEDAARVPAPTPGGPVAWPVEDVTIVSATLTEVRYSTSDGTVLLVPAYDLTDADGSTWTVLAVADELLDFAP